MPFLLAQEDAFEVIPYFRFGGQVGLTIFRYYVSNVGTGAVLDQDVCTWFTSYATGPMVPAIFKAGLCVNVDYLGLSVQITGPNRRPLVWTVAGIGNGSIVASVLPTQTSGLISKYTNTATRHGRGRNYWPFPCDADKVAGASDSPTPAYVTYLQGICNVMYPLPWPMVIEAAPGNSIEVTGMVYNPRVSATLPNFYPIVKTVPRAKWATQRRRGDYGRLNSTPF